MAFLVRSSSQTSMQSILCRRLVSTFCARRVDWLPAHKWTNTVNRSQPCLPFSCLTASSCRTTLQHDSTKSLSAFFIKWGSSSLWYNKNFQQKSHRSDETFRPFDVDTNVPTDTVVYTYRNDKQFRLMGIFGIVMFIFWAHLSYFFHDVFSHMKDERMKAMFQGNTWHSKVLVVLAKHRDAISAMCLALSSLVGVCIYIIPRRTITKLTLLKGGHTVRLSTYSFLHLTRNFDTALENISCAHSRAASSNTLNLKVKDRWLYFQLNKDMGRFVQPHLFDHVVGLRRY